MHVVKKKVLTSIVNKTSQQVNVLYNNYCTTCKSAVNTKLLYYC